MGFDQYYVALLRKGPTWSPESNSAVEQTQKIHLAHLAGPRQAGMPSVSEIVFTCAGCYRDLSAQIDAYRQGLELFPDRTEADLFIWTWQNGDVLEAST